MTERKPFIAVNLTPAMSGYFATYYTWSKIEPGVNIHGKPYGEFWFPEPWTTGFGRYATWQEANAEAEEWAKVEGVEVRLATAELVAEAEARAEVSRKRRRQERSPN